MNIETKTVYTCDHCKRKMFTKGSMTRHEKNCSKNPLNIDACLFCKHIEEREVEIFYEVLEDYDRPTGKKTKEFFCKHFQKKLYPFVVEKKRLHIKYPETFKDQERMPIKCESYQFEYLSI